MVSLIKVLICIGIFTFFIFYPLVIYWTKKMEDLWQLRFVFGKMGTGKTALIVIGALKDLMNPQIQHVYTNIGVPGTRKFDPKDIGKGFTFPPYSSVYIDEFGLLYNSRDFKTFPKQAREWFKYMRQSRCKCTVYSQAPDIDKSVRDMAHSYGLLRRIGPFTLEFDISKNIDVGSDLQGNGQLIDNYFKAGIIGGLHIHYLPRYFNLWKSYDPPIREYIESDLIPLNPAVLRATKIKKWYPFNFRSVYPKLCAGVSGVLHRLYNSVFKGTFFLSVRDYMELQLLNLETRNRSEDSFTSLL